MPTIKKAAAIQAACGLYSSLNFAPIRLNVADDPTRDAPLRLPSELSCTRNLSLLQLQRLHSRPFSRPVASWIRLVLLCGFCPSFVDAADSVSSSSTPGLSFKPLICLWSLFLIFGLAMLACVGGGFRTRTPNPRIVFGKQWFHRSHCPLVLLICCCPGVAMIVSGMTPADRERAGRRSGTTLFADRVLKPQTRSRKKETCSDVRCLAE